MVLLTELLDGTFLRVVNLLGGHDGEVMGGKSGRRVNWRISRPFICGGPQIGLMRYQWGYTSDTYGTQARLTAPPFFCDRIY